MKWLRRTFDDIARGIDRAFQNGVAWEVYVIVATVVVIATWV